MADTAGLGGLDSLYVTPEATYGTYVDPADGTGAWMPILTESLHYAEDKYYSPQIRETTAMSDVKSSYYHVEGDIEFEVDANFLPYFLVGTRLTVVETGTSPTYIYTCVPSTFGSAYPGGDQTGLSFTAVRNGEGFGYFGCVVGQFAFTLDTGILKCTASIQGLGEVLPDDLDVTSWIAPALFGADATTISTGASDTSPTFAEADNFDGYTATINFNAAAVNRIKPDREAAFVQFGETEVTIETSLDFLDRTEYDKMVSNTQIAIKSESCIPSGTFASATQAVKLQFNRCQYNTYEVDTPAMADLVMANVSAQSINIAGGDQFSIVCKSTVDLGL